MAVGCRAFYIFAGRCNGCLINLCARDPAGKCGSCLTDKPAKSVFGSQIAGISDDCGLMFCSAICANRRVGILFVQFGYQYRIMGGILPEVVSHRVAKRTGSGSYHTFVCHRKCRFVYLNSARDSGRTWHNGVPRTTEEESLSYAAVNQPLMVPEIVTGVALLIFFAIFKSMTGYHGLFYLMLAHTAFCIPFAYLPIRARLEGMDISLETAAQDLYATPWKTFTRITLPLLWPGILAGAMLSFVISLDDVVNHRAC